MIPRRKITASEKSITLKFFTRSSQARANREKKCITNGASSTTARSSSEKVDCSTTYEIDQSVNEIDENSLKPLDVLKIILGDFQGGEIVINREYTPGDISDESDVEFVCEIPSPAQPITPPNTPPLDKEVEDILTNFQNLDCNEYHAHRSKSKEAMKMICDCSLTEEEIARGDLGCGEDCLNRLMMIECGARCRLGKHCSNKRFQNREYIKSEVFKTDLKGFGLRALEDVPADTFLFEYVGEVVDSEEFSKRAEDYAKDKNRHFYFMALQSDLIIDATQKANISRFINHSCDPNAETQKWTVNGKLCVGVFSTRTISSGEEITFNYQLQRYGKQAQRCYCQAASCRGWIGEDPEKENKSSNSSGKNRVKRGKGLPESSSEDDSSPHSSTEDESD